MIWLILLISGLCGTIFIYLYALLVIMLFIAEVLLHTQGEEGRDRNDA